MASEIYELIEEMEQPFISGAGALNSVRDRINLIDSIVYTRYDYSKELSPLITQKLSVEADPLRAYKEQAKAALADDIVLHLDPVGDHKREETAADRMEVLEAHTLMRLDPDGFVLDSQRYALAVQLYWAGWLEQLPYVAPAQGKGEKEGAWQDRAEKHRKGWFGWELTPLNPSTVAWTEHRRKPTGASRRYRLPVIDLLERFGADYEVRRENPEHALRIFNEHFGYLRADEEQGEDYTERDLWRNEVEVCVYADKGKICHYADFYPGAEAGDKRLLNRKLKQGEKKDDTRYRLLNETENPFGEVPLLLAEGVYNWWQPLAYRREPLIMGLIRIEHGKSRLKSHWASRAASPPLLYQALPPEAMQDKQTASQIAAPLVDAQGRPLIMNTWSEVKEVERRVEDQLDKLFGIWEGETAVSSPRGLLHDPQADLGKIPATTVLLDSDERNRLLSGAKQSMCNVWSTALDMIKHSRVNTLNKHRKAGDAAQRSDWGQAITTTGREWRVEGKVIKRGEAVEIKAQDYDVEMTRTIKMVDNRASTQAARGQEAERRWANGTMIWREFAEANGVSNVTEFNEQKTEEQLYQVTITQEIMKTVQEVATFAALVNNTSVEEELMKLPPDAAPQIASATNPGSGPYRMGSPEVEPTGGAPSGVEGLVV